jgi:acyl dehydratase
MTSTLPPLTLAEFKTHIGTEIGTSRWHIIDQERIDAFADVTEDRQHIHVDPGQAKAGPFGGTIAHGFLSLSLLSVMNYEAVPPLAGLSHSVNYGFDRIRFLAPVPSGTEVRGTFTITAIEPRGDRHHLFRYAVTIRARDAERPALHADWLVLQVMAETFSEGA